MILRGTKHVLQQAGKVGISRPLLQQRPRVIELGALERLVPGGLGGGIAAERLDGLLGRLPQPIKDAGPLLLGQLSTGPDQIRRRRHGRAIAAHPGQLSRLNPGVGNSRTTHHQRRGLLVEPGLPLKAATHRFHQLVHPLRRGLEGQLPLERHHREGQGEPRVVGSQSPSPLKGNLSLVGVGRKAIENQQLVNGLGCDHVGQVAELQPRHGHD